MFKKNCTWWRLLACSCKFIAFRASVSRFSQIGASNFKMSPSRSLSHWLFLLFFICSFQLKVLLAHTDYYGDYTGNVIEEDDETYQQPDSNYYYRGYSDLENNGIYHPISKRINKPRNLCRDLKGCECNGIYDRANCTCAVNGKRVLNQVNTF